jgi:phosphoribosylaminoimidazole-succinocarboxamide synthase
MPVIPISASRQFVNGLKLLKRGKVRDIYLLPNFPDLLLQVCTDRISIFDFVLNALMAYKGASLNAMNILSRILVFPDIEHDLVAYGSAIDEYLEGSPKDCRGNRELQARATVVRRLDVLNLEAIVRGYLTGGGYKTYQETFPHHKICGNSLPNGLRDGSQLENPIFTPTTKTDDGHDIDVPRDRVEIYYGPEPEQLSLALYQRARQYALDHGYILADTKFEFGYRPGDGKKQLVVADEMLTLDSSRYWLLPDWEQASPVGRSPEAKDKQIVRNWGKSIGVNTRNPATPKDVEWVHAQVVPQDLLKTTTGVYHKTLEGLFDVSLVEFQRRVLQIAA